MDKAEEAVRELVCDDGCQGLHSVTFVDGGRIRTKSGPRTTVLIATVIRGSSRLAMGGHLRLVDCPWCGARHQVSQRHIGTVRASACLRGFYEIRNPKGDNDDE